MPLMQEVQLVCVDEQVRQGEVQVRQRLFIRE